MIGNAVKELLLENEENFIIPAENVASLMDSHPLNHALLVLSQAGYSKIPVLDKADHFVGLISLSEIVNAMLDLTEIDPDNLANKTVGEVMETAAPTLCEPVDIEEILHKLVDVAFIPVIDKQGIFKGIVTRKEILKAVNHLAHELELDYDVQPKCMAVVEKKQIV